MTRKAIERYNEKQSELYAALTGFHVDIQNIGKNKETIMQKVRSSCAEIHKGVWLKTQPIEFADGNFTNVYDLFWNKNQADITSTIHSEQKPFYLLDRMEEDPLNIAVINGSFFFLIDVVDREPQDYPFHLCVRNGKVVGLPSSDEPAIYTVGAKMTAKEFKAKGTLRICDTVLSWVGTLHKNSAKKTADAVLYNSGSAKLIKFFDKKTGVRVGVLDNTRIHTPKNSGKVDLVINADKKGMLHIVSVRNGGGSHFFEGLFILQIDKKGNPYKVGDIVEPLTVDGVALKTISSAITVGKSVHDPYFYVPERVSSRDARSLIAEDVKGNTHFFVFDGSKYVPNFKGISAADISSFFAKDKYKWAYFLDGGSSSRIIVRDGKELKFLANDFAFKKITNDTFMWDSKRHRKLASFIAVRRKK